MAEQLAFDIIAKDINGKKELKALSKQSDEAGESLNHLSTESVQAGDSLDNMAESADRSTVAVGKNRQSTKELTKQIDDLKQHVKELVAEFDKTGDKTLFKKIRKDNSAIKFLEDLKKQLEDVEQAGTSTFDALLKGVSGRPMLIGAIAAIGASLLPALGAMVGGAIIGGVGTGGIVGGVIAAAHDGRVHDAFAAMGHDLSGAFKVSGEPFIEPLLHDLDQLKSTAFSALNLLHDGASKLAPVFHPLVMGIEGFVQALGPGLRETWVAAQPALRAFANELPRIGYAISYLLTAMSDESDGAVMGMIALSRYTEAFIRDLGDFIAEMSAAWEWLVRTGYAISVVAQNILDAHSALSHIPVIGMIFDAFSDSADALNDKTGQLLQGLKDAKDGSKDFAFELDHTADTAEEAAQKIQDFNDAIDALFGKQMSWDEAQIRLRDGLRDFIEELTHGKRTLSENSEEGDKNRKAILAQIQAIEDARDAYFQQTGSIDGANKMYQQQLDKLRVLLVQLGYNRDVVNDIIDAYRNLPAKASVPVESPGLATTQSRLNKVEDTLRFLDGRVVRTTLLVEELHREDARQYRAGGGSVAAGQAYVVGEHGPEIVEFGANGRVIPAAQSRALAGGTPAGPVQIELLVRAAPGASRDLMGHVVEGLQYEVRTTGQGSVVTLLEPA